MLHFWKSDPSTTRDYSFVEYTYSAQTLPIKDTRKSNIFLLLADGLTFRPPRRTRNQPPLRDKRHFQHQREPNDDVVTAGCGIPTHVRRMKCATETRGWGANLRRRFYIALDEAQRVRIFSQFYLCEKETRAKPLKNLNKKKNALLHEASKVLNYIRKC